jgi:hypothetical protein
MRTILVAVFLLLTGCASTPRATVTYPYARPDFVKPVDWEDCDPAAHRAADALYQSVQSGSAGYGTWGIAGMIAARGSAAQDEPEHRRLRDERYEDEMKRCLQGKGYPVAPVRPPPAGFTK